MNGADFLEQCRRELEASAERERLTSLLLAVEQLVGETPGCDVDGQKTLEELFGSAKRAVTMPVPWRRQKSLSVNISV